MILNINSVNIDVRQQTCLVHSLAYFNTLLSGHCSKSRNDDETVVAFYENKSFFARKQTQRSRRKYHIFLK